MNKQVTVTVLELRERLDQRQDQFARALTGTGIEPVQLIRNVETAALRQPRLLQCSFQSLFTAAMQAAQDGLRPDGREGVIVPYWNDKQKTYIAQWLPMIAGIRRKAYQSGEIAVLEVVGVFEGDDFTYQRGLDPNIHHVPGDIDDDPNKLTHVYSVAVLKNGFKTFDVMSRAAIERVRARSKAKDDGPWQTDFVEMCKKTAVKRHAKTLPTSSALETVLSRGDEIEGDFSVVERIAAHDRRKGRKQSAELARGRAQAIAHHEYDEGENASVDDRSAANVPVDDGSGERGEVGAPSADDAVLAQRPRGWRNSPDYQQGRDDYPNKCQHEDIRADKDRLDLWLYGWDDRKHEVEKERAA
jgi:recombination protein RecT